MLAQEAILKDLESLPASMLRQAADYIHALSERAAADRQAAFDTSFGSMPAEEADEFDRVIAEGCERIER